MFCRLIQKVGFVAQVVRAQQRHQPVLCNGQFVRLISQTGRLEHYDELKDKDFLFDLGGQSGQQETKKSKKLKKPSAATEDDETTASQSRRTRRTSREPRASSTTSKHNASDTTSTEAQDGTKAPTNKNRLRTEKKFQSFNELKYFDTSLNLEYVRLPKDHKQFSELMLMLKSKRYREKENLLLIEGSRLMNEAIEAGLQIKYLLFSKVENVEKNRKVLNKGLVAEQHSRSTIIRVPQGDLSFWSAQTTCPGIIAIFRKPSNMEDVWSKHRSTIDVDGVQTRTPVTIICDQIREPNNLGSLLRTCAAVACEKVIVLKGCADPWDSKALRGGCGAQFRTEIVHGVDWSNIDEHLPADKQTSVFLADNQVEHDEDTFMPVDEQDYRRKLRIEKRIHPKAYKDVSFGNCKHVTLVIGGETEGVSSRAYDFLRTRTEPNADGINKDDAAEQQIVPRNCVLQIPLGGGVESLNVGVATGILLFEIRQQMIGL